MHHSSADWLVWPVLIVLVLIWASLLGAYATERHRRRRDLLNRPIIGASEFSFPNRPLSPPYAGPCKTDKRGGGVYDDTH